MKEDHLGSSRHTIGKETNTIAVAGKPNASISRVFYNLCYDVEISEISDSISCRRQSSSRTFQPHTSLNGK